MDIIPIYFKHFKKNVKERFVGLVGSSRSGKTYSGLQWLFYLAQCGVKFECTIVGRSIPFLRDGAVNSFKEIAVNYPIIKSPFSVTINNASFLFRSFENESDAKGSERDFLYLNECNDLDYKVVQQLMMRTRIQTIADFNPTKRFWIDEYTNKKNLLKTTWKDNKYLAPAQIENFNKIRERAESVNASAFDKYLFSVFYLGEYGDMRGNVFGRVSECNVSEYEISTKHSKKLYGLDFGFSLDPCALCEMSIVLGVIYIKELLYQNQLNDFDLSKILVDVCSPDNPIICDFGSGGDARMSNIHQLTGLSVVKAVKGAGSIRNGVELLNTYPIVLCGENINREFNSYEFIDDSFSEKDNHCFIGETLINTNKGLVRIDDIKINDLVLTSKGYKKVLKTFNNGKRQVNKYSMLLGTNLVYLCSTKDHKIKTTKGWKEISKLKSGQTVYLCKNSTTKNITYIQTKSIFQKETKECTLLFMNFIILKLLKAFMFTIKTLILGIIILTTLNLSKAQNIYQNMVKIGLLKIKNGLKSFTVQVLKKLKSGINQMKGGSGIKSMVKTVGLVGNIKYWFANNAQMNTKQDIRDCQNFATTTVKLKHLDSGESWIENVYDIEVDDCHEYFANGVLVHNCIDSSRYAIDYAVRANYFN